MRFNKQNILLVIASLITALVSFDACTAAGTLNERNYKKLQNIHVLIENNKLHQAATRLKQFLTLKHDHYTQALFLQTAAHVSIQQEHYTQAISYLEQVDSLNALPDFVSQNILYNLAQLYLQRDQKSKSHKKNDLDKSLRALERWLSLKKLTKNNTSKGNISAEQHVFAATVYAQNKKNKPAISHVKKAINLSKQRGYEQLKKSRESWYQLLVSLYLEDKNYSQAIHLYQIMINLYPGNKNYWKQLSGLYLQQNKMPQALAVLALAKKQGLLSTEQELLHLINLYLYLEIPLPAAELLQESLRQGVIKPTIKNWLTLVNSWVMAQEYSQAVAVLQHIRTLDENNGWYQFRAGRLLMEQGKWQAAYQQFKGAQSKKLNDPGNNFLLQGICAYYAGLFEKAKYSLENAKKYKKYKLTANFWLEQLE